MEINISDETKAKIDKYVKDGRFKSVDDFVQQAIKLLLYAEDKKDDFLNIVKK